MDIGDLIHHQLSVSVHTSSTSDLCYLSLINRLYMEAECVWVADSERFLVRSVISRTSLLHNSRPARPHLVDEI